jgi:large subunit ribosomal protein L24
VRVIKGDIVEVQVGSQAAAERPNKVRGKVLRVIPKDGSVVVEGVNRHYKHVKRSQKYPQGGRVQREMPIDLSNVLPVCPKCDKGVRVGYKANEDGSKVRVCRKCGTTLHQLRKASKV